MNSRVIVIYTGIISFLVLLEVIFFYRLLNAFSIIQASPNKNDFQDKKFRVNETGVFHIIRECDLLSVVIEVSKLSWRFSCGIESIALLYPDKSICLFHDNMYNDTLFNKFPNVKLKLLDVDEVFRGTPAEFWYKNVRHLQKETWQLKELVDAIRLLIMYKQDGGVYFDLDMIFLTHLDTENKDMLAAQSLPITSKGSINCAFYLFQNNSYLLSYLVHSITGHFKFEMWGVNGFQLITDVFQLLSDKQKENVLVYPPEKFFPIAYYHNSKFVDSIKQKKGKENLKKIKNNSIGIHVWRLAFEHHENKRGEEIKNALKIRENSLISEIYREACPSAYQLRLLPKIKKNEGKKN